MTQPLMQTIHVGFYYFHAPIVSSFPLCSLTFWISGRSSTSARLPSLFAPGGYPDPLVGFVFNFILGCELCQDTNSPAWDLTNWEPDRENIMDVSNITLALVLRSTSVNDLPFDVLSIIFSMLVNDYWSFTDKLHFIARAFRLAHVCRYWNYVALGCPAFWRDYNIHASSSVDLAYRQLLYSAGTPLVLRLLLNSADVRPTPSTFDVFIPLRPPLHSLTVTASDAVAARDLASIFEVAEFGEIHDISLQCWFLYPDGGSVPLVNRQQGMSTLRSLRLHRVRFSWGLIASYVSLRVLVLRDIGTHFVPSWGDWCTLSVAAPNLERISLRRVGCIGIPVHPTPLLFARLTHMDLMFTSDDRTLQSLVGAIYAPQLYSLTVFGPDTSYLRNLMVFPSMLRHVESLVIRMRSVVAADIREFLALIPSVTSLDLPRHDLHVLHSITPDGVHADVSPGVMLPKLIVLAISSSGPASVHAYLASRLRPQTVDLVLFRNGLLHESWLDADVAWLEARFGVGVGAEYREADWLTHDRR
ncbi:hypothetical protein C8R44DRAFT_755063 [Mycena epipterygia]|nr:hypothetical protein C8R44DRAFT_755063 [Mycena epipterygia]